MPRTRTIKKGNRKGNRNVSRGNKYTLNRLKERNHKRKKTRLRSGPNRNNYNNLPKRTRKQRGGMDYARRGVSALKSGTEWSRDKFAPTSYNPKDLKDLKFSQALGAAVAPEAMIAEGVLKSAKYLSVEGTKKLKKNLNRTCFGSPEVKIDIVKPNETGVRRICGETKFKDNTREEEVALIKQNFHLTNDNALIMEKNTLKKIGMNTVRFFTKENDYLFVLAPVFTNLKNLKNHDIKFKTGTDKREIANIRNFFFYNVLAPELEESTTDKDKTNLKNLLRGIKDKKGGLGEEVLEYLVNKLDDKYVDLDNAGLFHKKKSAKNRLKKIKTFNGEEDVEVKLNNTHVGLLSTLKENNLETLKTKIESRYKKSKESKTIEKDKKKTNEDKEVEKVSRAREKLIMKLINQLIVDLKKKDQTPVENILNSLLKKHNLLTDYTVDSSNQDSKKPVSKIFTNRLCSNFQGIDKLEDLQQQQQKQPPKFRHFSPLISGIDVYRPTNVKALITGGIALQKRFFAVFDGTAIDQNSDITDKDLFNIQRTYKKKGMYINIRNKENFVKIKEFRDSDPEGKGPQIYKVRMLSYSDVEIERKPFIEFLIDLQKRREKKIEEREEAEEAAEAAGTEAAGQLTSSTSTQIGDGVDSDTGGTEANPPPPNWEFKQNDLNRAIDRLPGTQAGKTQERAPETSDGGDGDTGGTDTGDGVDREAPPPSAEPPAEPSAEPAATPSAPAEAAALSAAEEASAQIPKNTVPIRIEQAEVAIKGSKP